MIKPFEASSLRRIKINKANENKIRVSVDWASDKRTNCTHELERFLVNFLVSLSIVWPFVGMKEPALFCFVVEIIIESTH